MEIPISPVLRKGIFLPRSSPKVSRIRRERITEDHEKNFVADQGWPRFI
jgi:hypothetical protein